MLQKICKDCHRYFCSTCLPKPPSNQQKNGRQCNKCTILMSGKFTRQQLQDWRVKDMRCFLDARNISTSTCKEKHDLIDLVVLHFCVESNSAVQQEQNEHDRLVGELAVSIIVFSVFIFSLGQRASCKPSFMFVLGWRTSCER